MIVNFSSLAYRAKSILFSGFRRFFLICTFLLTPFQLAKFISWKLSRKSPTKGSVSSASTPDVTNSLNDQKKEFKVAVILHVFYPDIGIEILNQVLPRSNYFDKILITHSMAPTVLNEFQSTMPNELLSRSHFISVQNQYQDCGPFIQSVSSPYLSDCAAFLKLHTKKSPHLPNDEGSLWRQNLINSLLESHYMKRIILLLCSTSNASWSCPKEWLSTKKDWGFNTFQTWKLCKELGEESIQFEQFALGNMFWFNKELLSKYYKIRRPEGLSEKLFPQYLKDGLWTHAIERFPSNYSFINGTKY